LAEHIGPVKASSPRVASRISNRIRAGYAARHFSDLEGCGLIAIKMPDDALRATLREMAEDSGRWDGKALLVCESRLASTDLQCPEGASLATVEAVPTRRSALFVIEGDRSVVRVTRAMMGRGVRLVEILAHYKSVYHAAQDLIWGAVPPLAHATLACLLKCGLTPPLALELLQEEFPSALRSFAKARKKSWSGAIAERDGRQLARELDALRRADRKLAAFLETTSCSARELFGTL
jgi:hypothetical protein